MRIISGTALTKSDNDVEGIRSDGDLRSPSGVEDRASTSSWFVNKEGGSWHYHTEDSIPQECTGVTTREVHYFCPRHQLNKLVNWACTWPCASVQQPGRLAFHVHVSAGASQPAFHKRKDVFPCTRKCIRWITEFAWSSLGIFMVFTSSRSCACMLHQYMGNTRAEKLLIERRFCAWVKYTHNRKCVHGNGDR